MIDTRWTGHLQATKAVRSNYSEIVVTLQKVKSDKNNSMKLDGDDIATCIGIYTVITNAKFVFNLIFMDAFLNTLAPADSVFQSHTTGCHSAMNVIEAVKEMVAGYRTEYFPDKFDEFMAMAQEVMDFQSLDPPRPTRHRRRSTLLNDFVVEETIGERSNEYDQIRSCFYEVIDLTLAEFNDRFIENNEILSALANSPNMELKPLEKLGVAHRPHQNALAAGAPLVNASKGSLGSSTVLKGLCG